MYKIKIDYYYLILFRFFAYHLKFEVLKEAEKNRSTTTNRISNHRSIIDPEKKLFSMVIDFLLLLFFWKLEIQTKYNIMIGRLVSTTAVIIFILLILTYYCCC